MGRPSAAAGGLAARRPRASWWTAARRLARALGDDRVAASHLVYFLLSAALFLPLVGGMLYFMRDVSESQHDPAAGLEARSRDVVEKITGSAGTLHEDDWDGDPIVWEKEWHAWEQYGAGLRVSEVGIAMADSRRSLSIPKIENLQQAAIAADHDNAYLDYEEMKEGLRLDERFGFQLRIEPIETDLSVDPFGTRPMQGTHVAYVAGMNSAARDGAWEWTDLTAQAQKEVAALEALGLWDGDSGFDGTSWQPERCDGLSKKPMKNGTVVAGIAHTVEVPDPTLACGSPVTTPYAETFAAHLAAGSPFEVIVFGSGVDLQPWATAADLPERLSAFVTGGGTVIFLDNDNVPADFVSQCTGPPCLLHFDDDDAPPAMTSDDRTHQMLHTPNNVATAFVPGAVTGAGWAVCNQPGYDEEKAFFPIYRTPSGDCSEVQLGVTMPSRYGSGNGTVILSNLDLAPAADNDVAGLLGNMLSYGVLTGAYLTYGEELPDDRAVRVASRVMALELPNGAHISVKVKLYLWRNF